MSNLILNVTEYIKMYQYKSKQRLNILTSIENVENI